MEYLLKPDMLLINRKTVDKHGGSYVEPSNILNGDPLGYLLEAVHSSMFGAELYPSVHEKAGLYMFNAIGGHIFQDGNKRTGLAAALLFLRLNNYSLKKKLTKVESESKGMIPKSGETTNEILLEFTLSVARGELDLNDCQLWFSENIEPMFS